MAFKWKTLKGQSVAFSVVKEVKEEENLCELILQCNKGIPAVPRQEIIWTVEKSEEDLCQVKFIHRYKDHIKNTSLIISSKLKQKILDSFKNRVELEKMFKDFKV